MNPTIVHQNAEHKAKCWLKEKYTSHGTTNPEFSEFTGSVYEEEVKELAENIYTFVEDANAKRKYLNTLNLDW